MHQWIGEMQMEWKQSEVNMHVAHKHTNTPRNIENATNQNDSHFISSQSRPFAHILRNVVAS